MKTKHEDKANARDRKRDKTGWKASRKTQRRRKDKRQRIEGAWR